MAGATERWIQGREADWIHLDDKTLVEVEAGELKALLRCVRDMMDLVQDRIEREGTPMLRRPLYRGPYPDKETKPADGSDETAPPPARD